jgi:hypothetical protein
VTSVDWLEQRGLLDGSVRVAEEDFVGNYLGFRYGGTVRAFIDDRYDMHERALVDDYVKLVRGQRGWDEVLERREIDVVLWRRDSQLAELLERQPGWDLVFDSAVAEAGDIERPDGSGYVVYCRAGVTRCTSAVASTAVPASTAGR